jgi:hypothetical protein
VKLLGNIVLLIALGSVAIAQPVPTPEISSVPAGSALALIAGAVLVMRGRRKQ